MKKFSRVLLVALCISLCGLSVFAADPETWEMYPDVRMIFLRWKDANNDGLVQQEEITVETYV